MSNTYTTKAKLTKPGINDTGWGATLNGSLDMIDALGPVGALCVTTHEVPSASLMVDVAAGTFVDQAGSVQSYAGVSGYAVAASSTKVLYLDGSNSWALATASAYPATPHVRLAMVTTGTATVSSVADNRIAAQHCGQRLPQVTHLLSTATAAPGISAGAAAGTSPAASVAGTDLAGTISITTGTTPVAGTLATITFNVAFGSAPRAVLLTPANAAAAGLAGVYSNAANLATVHFTVDAATAPAASTAYQWYYTVIG